MHTCCFLELACYCLNSGGLKKRSVISKHLFSGSFSEDGKSTAEPASLRKPAYNVFLFLPLMAGLVLPHCFEHCMSFSLLASELWCWETGFVEKERVARISSDLHFSWRVSLCFLLCQLSYLIFFFPQLLLFSHPYEMTYSRQRLPVRALRQISCKCTFLHTNLN